MLLCRDGTGNAGTQCCGTLNALQYIGVASSGDDRKTGFHQVDFSKLKYVPSGEHSKGARRDTGSM